MEEGPTRPPDQTGGRKKARRTRHASACGERLGRRQQLCYIKGQDRMSLLSPLRYPGGKAGLAPFLTDVLDLNDLRGAHYFEPYAGGAGAALGLLADNTVETIAINDADIRIYAFWTTVLNNPSWFTGKILQSRLDLDEWREQRSICKNPQGIELRDVGFAAFYMNRCNRSGVLNGGPIGGYQQAGEWRLDVRFSREALVDRILKISALRERISVSNLDAVEFLKTKLPRGSGRKRAFVYLDPPYVVKGQRLYMNSYDTGDHSEIAKYICRQTTLPWVMSYDDAQLVRALYTTEQIAYLPINYSLQDKRAANELVIAPHRVRLPRTLRIGAKRFNFREINKRSAA
jgi:DNA adenine methylase